MVPRNHIWKDVLGQVITMPLPRLDLGEYAVECGLVNEHTRQDGLVSPRPGLESGERGADRVAQMAADTNPVTLWPRIDELDGGLPDRT